MATITPSIPDGSLGRRGVSVVSLAVNTSIGSCDILDMRGFGGASILVPASVTVLTFHGSADGVNFAPIYDNAATSAAAAPSVTASTWVPFPDACFAMAFVKIVTTTASGTATVILKT